MSDSIISSYQKSNTKITEIKKKIIRKVIISSLISLVLFLLFSLWLFFTPIGFIVVFLQVTLITTISTLCELKLTNWPVVRVILTIFFQVLIPPLLVAPFDRLYGILIVLTLFNSLLFTVVDYTVRLSFKRRNRIKKIN